MQMTWNLILDGTLREKNKFCVYVTPANETVEERASLK